MSIKKQAFSFLSKKQKKDLIVLTILLIIGLLLEMCSLGVILPVLSIIFNNNILSEYPFLIQLFNFLGHFTQNKLVILGMSLLVFVFIIKNSFLLFLSTRQASFIAKLSGEISLKLFKGYLNQPYSFHLNRNSSTLLRNLQGEIIQFTNVSQAFIILASELSMVLASIFVLVIIEPIGAIFLAFFLITFTLIFHKITKNKLIKWGKQRQDTDGEINLNLTQGLTGIKVLKITNSEKFFYEKVNEQNNKRVIVVTKQIALQYVPRLYLELLSIIGLSGLVIILVFQNKPIMVLLPVISIFVAAAFRMIPSVNRIMAGFQTIRYAQPVIELLYNEFEIINKETIQIDNQNNDYFTFNDLIEINKLYFKYSSNGNTTISDISLKIKKGESVGFIGPSGSGKSTLIDLILGLLKPNQGDIFIDGLSLKNNLHNWQKIIGYIPQTIFLIDDSIKNNIAFGIDNDIINIERLNNVIIQAQLESLILTLPNGIDTIVGEAGVRLSGGQRQRIGIARALYNNPEILVLDEATSSLDIETEKEVMKSIDAFHNLKTIIIVAHRLSTVKYCDKIYCLEKGEITKEGSPSDILN
jgi:ABC-type multidrug transport system fused ATPase/permease subunit